jgi:hypothetical protein
MIYLLVDEAYAFDYLSILEVKHKADQSVSKEQTYTECKKILQKQIIDFDKIYSSSEYYDLLVANQLTFNLIDKLRLGEQITAKEIDDVNISRFLKKQILQNKFFNNGMTEEKNFRS